MLILTRKIGETIIINDDITVTVLGVTGNQVRLGMDAPKNISIHREEVWKRINKEKNVAPTTDKEKNDEKEKGKK